VTEDQAIDLDNYDKRAFNFIHLWLASFAILFVVGLLISGCREQHATRDNKPLVAQRYDYWNGDKR
jgi:hypothetical protein